MEKEIIIKSVDDFDILKHNSWSGALDTLEKIEEKGKENEFLTLINEIIVNQEEPMTDTQLNDFINFDIEFIEDYLNIKLWD